jgi:hypothetical protein
MENLIVASLVVIVIAGMTANKYHDAYRSHADWQRLYKYQPCFDRWYLRWFKRKFSNRWHIVKQIMFIPPYSALVLLIAFEYGHLYLAICTGLAGPVIWKWVIPSPEWWYDDEGV